MTPDLKALRIDGRHPSDAGYPFQDNWSLVAAPGYETAVAELAPHLKAALAGEPVVHLAAVGDLMLDRSLGVALSNGKLDYPFAYVAALLKAADYTVGNLESAMGTVGEPAAKRYAFRAPPEAAEALSLAGFDLVTLANNHGADYGPDALLQALELLRAQHVATVGAGANDMAAHAAHVAEVNGLKLGFLGYVHVPVEAITNFDVQSWTAQAGVPGLAWGDPERIRMDVAALRPQVDLVIVLLHSGYEYVEEPSEPQRLAAKAAIDAGADLVIGHHAHILQGIERYDRGVIVYGLGNFAFVIDGPPETAILNVWLDRDGVRQLELIPAIIQTGGQPRPAESWEAGPILQRVYQLTRLLNPQEK
jgi:poly-gamma-glutamate synthesis protein (capsule biosynthesis protein)